MFDIFLATLSPMLFMFLCIAIGFVLNKKKLCPENTSTVLSKLETYVLAPALTINTFSKYCTVQSLSAQYQMLLYNLLAICLAIGIAYLLAPLFEKKGYQRSIYRYSLAIANLGFLGNAIVPVIFGEARLYDYMLFTLPATLAVYTWGIASLIPRSAEHPNPLRNLLNPSVFAVIIGATLGLTGLTAHLPSFVTITLSNLSNCMGPIAMVLTGFIIANYPIKKLISVKNIYTLSLLRLIVLPAFFILLLKFLGADDITLTMTLFCFGTPLGLNTIVFPAAYGGDTSTGASMAMVSHTLSIITIPVMYVLMKLFILA